MLIFIPFQRQHAKVWIETDTGAPKTPARHPEIRSSIYSQPTAQLLLKMTMTMAPAMAATAPLKRG
jgi:hypothetical protein